MKKPLLFALAALVVFAGMSPSAHAQTMYGPVYNQPVSPYLNILRGGAPPGLNYFNIVQPQLQFESQIGLLQQQTGALYSGQLGPGAALSTGHPVQFGNYSHYFGGGGAASGSRPGTNVPVNVGQAGLVSQGAFPGVGVFPGVGGIGPMGLGVGR